MPSLRDAIRMKVNHKRNIEAELSGNRSKKLSRRSKLGELLVLTTEIGSEPAARPHF